MQYRMILGAKWIHYSGNGITAGMPVDNGAYFKAGVGDNKYKLHFFRATTTNGGLLYNQLTSGDTPSANDWKVVYDESILTNSTVLSPLASALGGWTKQDNPSSLKKAYSKPFYGMYKSTSAQDAPSNYGFYFAFPMTQPNGNVDNGLVIAVQNDFTKLFITGSWGSSGYNSKWTEVSLIQQS